MTIRLVVALVVLALASWGGWEWRGSVDNAERLEALQAAQKQADEARAAGDKLAAELEQARRQIRTVEVEVVREIPKVTTVYVEKPSDPIIRPIPAAVLTWGFVGLWDRALRPDLPDAASGPAGAASGARIARAPADTPDLLANHAVNAAGYAECRRQLNALIDWYEGQAAGRR